MLVVYPKKNPHKNIKTADRYVAFITNVKVDNHKIYSGSY